MPGEFYIEGRLEKLNIQALIELFLKLQRSGQSGRKTMTSAYTPVYEQSGNAAYIFAGGKIDLSPMEAGDTISVRARTILEAGGSYEVSEEKSYRGVQPANRKVIRLNSMPDNYGLEISMKQTAGIMKHILCEFFEAKR